MDTDIVSPPENRFIPKHDWRPMWKPVILPPQYRQRTNGTRTNRCPASPRMANLGSVTALNIERVRGGRGVEWSTRRWRQGEGKGKQGTSCGEANTMCQLTNARMRPGANTHVYIRFNVSRIARYRPRYWFISSTSFPGSLSPLHSFKTRTRTPRFLVVEEERLKGRKRMIKETAASSSLEDIKALRWCEIVKVKLAFRILRKIRLKSVCGAYQFHLCLYDTYIRAYMCMCNDVLLLRRRLMNRCNY